MNKMIVFLIAFFLLFASYSLYLIPHYGTDTYAHIEFSDSDTSRGLSYTTHINNGRPTGIIFDYFGTKVNYAGHQTFFIFLALVILALLFSQAAFLFIRNNLNDTPKVLKYVALLGFFPMYSNIFLSEYFCFSEVVFNFAVYYGLAQFSAINLALKPFSFKSVILSALIFIVTFNAGQTVGSVFFAFLFIFIYIKNSTPTFEDIKKTIAGGIIFASAFALNIAFIKMFSSGYGNERISGLFKSFDNVMVIFSNTFMRLLFIDNYYLMPKYLFAGVVIGAFTLMAIMIIRSKLAFIHKMYYLFVPLLISLFLLLLVLSPQIITKPWPAHRTMYMLPSVLTVFLLVLTIFLKNNFYKKISYAVCCLVAVYILISSLNTNKMAASLLAQNQIDRIESTQLVNTIQKYENENNVTVTKLCFINENSAWSMVGYPLSTSMYDFNLRGLVVSWARVNLIRHYTGREFIQIFEDPVLAKEKAHFTGAPPYDWHEVVVIADTAYIALH